MAPQLLVLRQVAPFGQEMDIEIGEDCSERVGVVLRPPIAVAAGDLEPVREDLRVERKDRLEHPVGVDAGLEVRCVAPVPRTTWTSRARGWITRTET